MKKVLFLLLIFATSLSAQRSWAALKIGFYNPSVTDGGLILGYHGGKKIDDKLDIGWSVDWFNKNYVDKTLAEQFGSFNDGINEEINELRAKTNLHDIPVLFNATATFDVNKQADVYANVGVGAEILLVFYRDYENPDEDELKTAFDFSWRLSFGGRYRLGYSSFIIAELSYHSSEPSWEFEVEDPETGAKKTFERVYDMSGIMLRTGIQYYF